MRKCIVIPDSFKGTLSAPEAGEIMGDRVKRWFPQCQVHVLPAADGGEGTVECFAKALEMNLVKKQVHGPMGEYVEAAYGKREELAVLEVASVAGLPYAEKIGQKNPAKATTKGLGELMLDALEQGSRNMVIGLGGSCTNDGGTGMAEALGVKFYNKEGKPFSPSPLELVKISRIDTSQARKRLEGCQITAMCDVENPMFGRKGAAFCFVEQKGADMELIKRLDENLEALGECIKCSLGMSVGEIPGAGAAGGLGAGILAFAGGRLKSGIDTVLQLTGYESLLKGADLVITGEGKLDKQSVCGKVVSGVAQRAKAAGVPVLAVAGAIGEGAELAYKMGVTAMFSINQQAEDFSTARYKSRENLEKVMDNLMRVMCISLNPPPSP